MRLEQFVADVAERTRGPVRTTGERVAAQAHGTATATVPGLTRRKGNGTLRVFVAGMDTAGDVETVAGGYNAS